MVLVLAIVCAGCGDQKESAAGGGGEASIAAGSGSAHLASSRAIDSARSLLDTRQAEEAERVLKKALEENPDDALLLTLLGAALVERSRYVDAEAHFRRAVELDSAQADAAARLGWLLYQRQGKALEAKEQLRRALDTDPDHERARYNLGLVHLREGELDSAATVFASLLERIPSAEAHRQLGLTYLQRGELDRAARQLEEAARWSPHDTQVLVGLGQAMARQGRVDSARSLLERAERLRQEEKELRPLRTAAIRHPNRPQTHFNLGVAYARLGRWELARLEYRRALALDPSYGRAYKGLGTLAMTAGEPKRAEFFFRAALARDSTLAMAHNSLGLIYHGRGRLADAVEQFEAAARDAPGEAPLWANIARAYRDLGHIGQARRAASKALEVDPTLDGAREVLGDVYSLEGKLERALENWKRAAQSRPDDSGLVAKIEHAERVLQSKLP